MDAAAEKMRAEGLPDVAVETFSRYRSRLASGDRGVLPEAEIEPVAELPDAEQLPDDPAGAEEALRRAVVIKLNGGLGTGMGMTQAKSLLEVKDGLTFLDIIARQILGLRERAGAAVPLVLMNSFATREDSLAALERYPDLAIEGLPLDFPQGRVPKLLEDTLEPAEWPADPKLEWAPRGTATSTRRSPAPGCWRRSWSVASSTPSCRTRTTSGPLSTCASSPGSRGRACHS